VLFAAVATSLHAVTVFSGFLGAGKTTILLNLVRQLNANNDSSSSGSDGGYRVAWLKNEYGEVAVDSRLAAESSIDVTEVLNGCVCCTAVGKLGQLDAIAADSCCDRSYCLLSCCLCIPLHLSPQRV